jgi:HK97 family phage portal protein
VNTIGRLIDRFKKTTNPQEKRVNINDPHYWNEFFSKIGVTTKSNQNVTPDSAFRSTTVYACVRVLAETIASLPLMVYRKRPDGGREPAPEFYLHSLMHDIPNPQQTSFELREMLMGHISLRGNAYSYLERDNGGFIRNIYPLNPAMMQVKLIDGKLLYEYNQEGITRIFTEDQIWHWKGLSNDGIVGLSPVSIARESIGLGLLAEDHEARLLANSARAGGILEFPGKLTEDTRTRLKKSIHDSQTGANAYDTMILEGGLKWSQIGMSNIDAQFLELRNFQVEDICRIFRVPAVLIQHPDKTMTYASAEQFFLSFVQHSIRPWCVRIEQSANKILLTDQQRKKFFIEFKLDGLLRGDLKTRYEAYRIGRMSGWLSTNDIRALENMNPIINGDEYIQPTNFANIGGNQNGSSS